MDLILSTFPILLLIYLMTRKKSVPSHWALPFVALLLYFIKLFYFHSDPNQVHAAVLDGLLTAWTPILIVWGAIFLFRAMEHTGALEAIRTSLCGITENRVAQLMIVGWAFAFLVEGASGFGTPAALAAPILVGLGFKPLRVASLCLIMNSIPVSFGAVGTPTWFGLGQLGLSPDQVLEVEFKSAVMHSIAALVIPLLALRLVVSWQEIRRNLLFIYLSILGCTLPYTTLAYFNYEFPAILGGMVGLPFTIWFATKGVGLYGGRGDVRNQTRIAPAHVAKALFPLWGTVLILLVTRINQLGLKEWLTSAEPALHVPLGWVGELSISSSLVIGLNSIFGTESAWSHAILYVPSILPFFLVSLISFVLFKADAGIVKKTWNETCGRMHRPLIALLGALVFVKLLMMGGDRSSTMVIGTSLAGTAGNNWPLLAPYLGALGSFFSGSNTISNLTFGGIQDTIALQLGLNRTTILALQSVGGAMGNMVSIHNIVAVCSILGIGNQEGHILRKTIIPLLIYGALAAWVGMWWL